MTFCRMDIVVSKREREREREKQKKTGTDGHQRRIEIAALDIRKRSCFVVLLLFFFRFEGQLFIVSTVLWLRFLFGEEEEEEEKKEKGTQWKWDFAARPWTAMCAILESVRPSDVKERAGRTQQPSKTFRRSFCFFLFFLCRTFFFVAHFHSVVPSFCELSRIWANLNEFYWVVTVSPVFYLALPSFTLFYLVWPRVT